jgi:phytoene dehydrogenase-like protein
MTAGEHDVIVVGSGHNALIAAAYLGVSGLNVLVLEEQARAGGNTMTEELTLPGFLHDSCSTAHTLLQANPLMQRNELQLSERGLRYILPDPAFVVPFADGGSITMHRELEGTVAEIARYSVRDAAAYRRLLADWEALRPLQATERNAPPLPPEDATRLWRSGALGDEGLRLRMMSGLDVVRERFEDPHVQTFIAWVAMMTLEPIDQPYTGILPFSLTAGRQASSWAIPAGGSGALIDALSLVVRSHGGEIVCHAPVDQIVVEGDRAVGVVTRDGRAFQARKAVLSSAHIAQLPTALGDHLDPESTASMERWQSGLTMFVSHYALSEAPRYRTHDSATGAVAMGVLESIDNLQEHLANFRRGRLHLERPFLLCLNASLADPSRAPAGQHTLKIVAIQPYELGGDPLRWDASKEDVSSSLLDTYLSYTTNLRKEHILATAIESPVDLERRNRNNFRGSCHGGAGSPTQTGWYRPAPRWNGYRTPLAGLYLTGSCTHPGGSVSGFPGRNAARVILEDLNLSWEDALATAGAPATQYAV